MVHRDWRYPDGRGYSEQDVHLQEEDVPYLPSYCCRTPRRSLGREEHGDEHHAERPC